MIPSEPEKLTFTGDEHSTKAFYQILKALEALPLDKVTSTRDWNSGQWPYNSDHRETTCIFSDNGEEVIRTNAERESCHGTMDDEYTYEIAVSANREELVALVQDLWV